MAVDSLVLDHLVVGAASVEAGVAWVRDRLGVVMPAGGKHPLMSTHNHLMRIADGVFLEVIAIDPDAPDPGRPRWFALDEPEQRRRLAEGPRLVTWVAGTSNIDGAVARCPVPVGTPITMSRGALTWQIAFRADGSLGEDGLLPVLIQWPEGPHPSSRMQDLGVVLEGVRLCHPEPARLAALLATLGEGAPVAVAAGTDRRIEADFRLPDGRVVTLS